jgi:hypothetical protein
LALSAFYATSLSAKRSPSCLRDLGERGVALSSLVEWLAQAESAQGSDVAQLKKEVTSADIERLLEELAWALRNA